MGLPAKFLTLLVRAYQVTLSPMMGGACRFEPSCSNYMIEALRVHGAIKGTLLGLWRILRCHPFGAYGYDPVPPVWKTGMQPITPYGQVWGREVPFVSPYI